MTTCDLRRVLRKGSDGEWRGGAWLLEGTRDEGVHRRWVGKRLQTFILGYQAFCSSLPLDGPFDVPDDDGAWVEGGSTMSNTFYFPDILQQHEGESRKSLPARRHPNGPEMWDLQYGQSTLDSAVPLWKLKASYRSYQPEIGTSPDLGLPGTFCTHVPSLLSNEWGFDLCVAHSMHVVVSIRAVQTWFTCCLTEVVCCIAVKA